MDALHLPTGPLTWTTRVLALELSFTPPQPHSSLLILQLHQRELPEARADSVSPESSSYHLVAGSSRKCLVTWRFSSPTSSSFCLNCLFHGRLPSSGFISCLRQVPAPRLCYTGYPLLKSCLDDLFYMPGTSPRQGRDASGS